MRRILLSIFAVVASLSLYAKHEPTPVYLVAGQSNTDGRVPISKLPDYIKQNRYKHCYWSYGSGAISGNGQFELFWPRVANKKPHELWGYDAVVDYLLDQSLGQDFYVIKESLGGTAIDTAASSNGKMYWSADPSYLARTAATDKGGKSLLKAFTDNIGACIDNKLSHLKGGYDIKALLWHQGESDIKRSGYYHDNLKAVIDYIRQYLVSKTGNKRYAQLPVIIGGIVHSGNGHSNNVALAQIRLSWEDPNVHFVDVHDATLQGDNLHFDAAGAEMLGRKVFNQLTDLHLAGKNAKSVAYKQHSRIIPVGNGQAFMYADFPDQSADSMRAVVALPGGGYEHLAISHEGTGWTKFFNDQGIAYFTLIYRMPNGNPNLPVSDAEAAIRLVRDSAEAWHIDPHKIGIMGSSAGGHLASTVATHADKASKPDFQILFYPVITFTGATHNGSKKEFLGSDYDNPTLVQLYSNEMQVKKDTPPALILLASDDRGVPPISNGVAYYEALVRNGVSAALFCYPSGGHGFGFKPTFKYHSQLLRDIRSWLK